MKTLADKEFTEIGFYPKTADYWMMFKWVKFGLSEGMKRPMITFCFEFIAHPEEYFFASFALNKTSNALIDNFYFGTQQCHRFLDYLMINCPSERKLLPRIKLLRLEVSRAFKLPLKAEAGLAEYSNCLRFVLDRKIFGD